MDRTFFEKNKEMRRLASGILHSLLDGKISTSDAIEKWPRNSNDSLIETIYCLLFHIRDDEKIRSKDKRHSDWQDNEFKKLLKDLEMN